jgi:integrase/recombinase XerD
MSETHDDLPLFSVPVPELRSERPRTARPRAETALQAAIDAWGAALAQAGRSPHTVKAFTADLRLMAQFLGGGQPVRAIGTHDLRRFLDWMVKGRRVPCSPKTYSRRVTSIKAFFRWLEEGGVLTADPAAAVPQQTVLSPLPEVLDDTEVEAILRAADRLRHADPPDARPLTLFQLLLHTGIKKGECLALHVNHVDLRSVEGPILYVRYGDVRKRYKERKLALDTDWLPVYREYLAQYKPGDQLFPWSPRRLEYILEDLGKLAGLEKHVSFDMCRWSCALHDLKTGLDGDRIRQKLGLSKIQWREIGAKLDRLAAETT